MELTWLECLIYGLISGFAEFLPVSALAHQTIYLKLLGEENDPMLQFCAYLGAFAALLIFCFPNLLRLRRERKLAAMPKNRRRRQPDFGLLMESRVFRMAAASMLVIFLGYSLVNELYQRLWVLAIFMGINGIVLYMPPYMPGANKSAQSLSGLDAMIIGLFAGAGIVPGISRIGCAVSAAQMRGAERRYAMELALLVSVPALLALMVICLAAALPAAGFSGMLVLRCVCVTLAAFISGYLGIYFMRFLAVKSGCSGFAYYCWGTALFALLIYLI